MGHGGKQHMFFAINNIMIDIMMYKSYRASKNIVQSFARHRFVVTGPRSLVHLGSGPFWSGDPSAKGSGIPARLSRNILLGSGNPLRWIK